MEIIKRTSQNHQHSVWVAEMIHLAKNKYYADWVINADADEFYYSSCLDLKKVFCKVREGMFYGLILFSFFLKIEKTG